MIAFHPQRVQLEPAAAVLVPEGVEYHRDPVRGKRVVPVHHLVAARERGSHTGSALRFEHSGADVYGGFIVQDPQLGLLCSRLAFVRPLLEELRDRGRGGPGCFIYPAVDRYVPLPSSRFRDWPGIVLGESRLLRCSWQRERECAEKCGGDKNGRVNPHLVLQIFLFGGWDKRLDSRTAADLDPPSGHKVGTA